MTQATKVTIIGLGLIGSSLAHALNASGKAYEITGYDVNADVRAVATRIGFCQTVSESLINAVAHADIVVLAVPVRAYAKIAEEMAPHLQSHTIVSDVGSVKGSVVRDLLPFVKAANLVPAHPIAGTEQSGPDAGFASLFKNRWLVITPVEGSAPENIQIIRQLWEDCGGNIEVMTPEHHDLVLAITSHLPHLIAYNIVGTAADLEDHLKSEVIKFSASGFRDFTRIAASDPTMWSDIFLNNKEAVLEALARFSEDLAALQRAIRWGEGDALHALFSRTRDIRRSIVEAGQDTPAPDFGRVSPDETALS
jgi:cyclohexadieny/prephenate dehydrogenase